MLLLKRSCYITFSTKQKDAKTVAKTVNLPLSVLPKSLQIDLDTLPMSMVYMPLQIEMNFDKFKSLNIFKELSNLWEPFLAELQEIRNHIQTVEVEMISNETNQLKNSAKKIKDLISFHDYEPPEYFNSQTLATSINDELLMHKAKQKVIVYFLLDLPLMSLIQLPNYNVPKHLSSTYLKFIYSFY